MDQQGLEKIHDQCGWHVDAVRASNQVGCFYCLAIFPSTDVSEWVEEDPKCPRGPGLTALCPKCGIDSILPDSLWFDLTPELLKEMNQHFF